MNKATKRNVLASALLSIMLCVSLIAGATYALFTSESKVNVAVTSGKVDVKASIENLQLYSAQTVSKTEATDYQPVSQFTNGGTATLDEEGNLTLDKMTPGDRATFTINVANNSNVSAIYRTSVFVSENTGLYEELEITVDNAPMTTGKTAWKPIDFADKQYNVTVDLPAAATAQDVKCTLAFTVEAMQGNAVTNDITATELASILRTPVNGVVTLEKDYDVIDEWTSLTGLPVNSEGVYVLNGNGHTITGLTMPLLGANAATNVKIENLTIADSNIGSIAYSIENPYSYHSGAFVAAMISGPKSLVLNNCHTKNVNVTGSQGSASSAGSLVGYTYLQGANDSVGVRSISITDCTVTGGSVKNNYGNAAGIVGMCATSTYTDSENNACSYKIGNCEVNGCNIQGEAENKTGEIVGTINGDGTLYITNCTYTGNAFGRIVGAQAIIDDTVYCQSAYLNNILASGTKEPIASSTYKKMTVTLDKDYVLLDAWTPFSYGVYGTANKDVGELVIEGGEHTVSGLTASFIKSVQGGEPHALTINNLTFEDANITDPSYANGMGNAVIVAYVENGNVTLNNCNVYNSFVTDTTVHSAALIGYISGSNETIKVLSCEVKATNVTGSNAAGFVGYVQEATVTVSGCEVSGSTFTGEATNKQGAYFGTVNAGAIVNITTNTTADTTALVGRTLADGHVNYNYTGL